MENELDQTSHSYSVDLNLHHPTRDPGEITKALVIEPWFAKQRGEFVGGIEHKATSWLCHFQQGDGNAEFNETLERVVSFLSKHDAFFSRFTEEDGTVEMVLKATVPFDDGKLLDLRLDPFLLNELAQRNVSLRVQAWSG
jgi:hypothetical protein